MFSEFAIRIQVTSVFSPMPGLSDDATGFIDRTLKISATGLSIIDPSLLFSTRGEPSVNAKIK